MRGRRFNFCTLVSRLLSDYSFCTSKQFLNILWHTVEYCIVQMSMGVGEITLVNLKQVFWWQQLQLLQMKWKCQPGCISAKHAYSHNSLTLTCDNHMVMIYLVRNAHHTIIHITNGEDIL